jgi:hypothetical protein
VPGRGLVAERARGEQAQPVESDRLLGDPLEERRDATVFRTSSQAATASQLVVTRLLYSYAAKTPPGRRIRSTSANVGSGSIHWSDCEQVTTSAQASGRPVADADAPT